MYLSPPPNPPQPHHIYSPLFQHEGKCALTYEAVMTRIFREGRTETVRSILVAKRHIRAEVEL